MSTTQEISEYNLSVEDVAEMFKVDKRTIRRWANDGRLPHRPRPVNDEGKQARRIMFRLSDIEEALREAGQTPPDSGRSGMNGLDVADALLTADEATEQ